MTPFFKLRKLPVVNGNKGNLVVKADNAGLVSALQAYHREMLTDNKKIAERLLVDHNIKMRCL